MEKCLRPERILAICVLLVACSSSHSSSSRPASSQLFSPSPASSPAGAAATANLSFTGGTPYLVGPATATPNQDVGTCGGGNVRVLISLQGRQWSIAAIVTNYHGPGRYTNADGLMVSLGAARELWSGSAGTATYTDDHSVTLDADLQNAAAPDGPGAHVSGSMSCA
jgi:hypothetical protein